MYCRRCGYVLWNLLEPRCPECGLEFDLHTYEFMPGTVEFACPHCGHQHRGQGADYQPVLNPGNQCAGCGRELAPRVLRVVPVAEPAVPAAWRTDQYGRLIHPELMQSNARVHTVPWESASAPGAWTLWWRTWSMTLADPPRLGMLIAREQPPIGALPFAFWIYLAIGATFACCLSPIPHGVVLLPVWLALVGVVPVVTLLTAHLVLRITGPARGGWGVTTAAILYGQGPCLLIAIPVLGMLFLWIVPIWSLIATMLILRPAQGVSWWRAFLAILLPLSLWGLVLILLLVSLMLQAVR